MRSWSRFPFGVLAARLQAARRVDHVDAVEPRGGGAVRHCTDLAGLALAVEERPAEPVVAPVADLRAGVPELLRVGLVGHVAQHPRDLAALDLEEELARELKVVPLLVDRVRTV